MCIFVTEITNNTFFFHPLFIPKPYKRPFLNFFFYLHIFKTVIHGFIIRTPQESHFYSVNPLQSLQFYFDFKAFYNKLYYLGSRSIKNNNIFCYTNSSLIDAKYANFLIDSVQQDCLPTGISGKLVL